MAKEGGRGIQSIDVAGRLLSALTAAHGPVMLRDLAAQADIAPAQAHAYLSSFKRTEMVSQDAISGQYQMGPFALRLGLSRINSYAPLAAARDSTIALEKRFGAMILMSVWAAGEPTAFLVQRGLTQLNDNMRPGMIMSLTGTATGRVFCAFSKDPEIQHRLETSVSQNEGRASFDIPDRATFDTDIAAIRERGYAISPLGPTPRADSIAAPVHDGSGDVLAVLSIRYPAGHPGVSSNDGLQVALLEEVDRLSARFAAAKATAE